MTFTPAQWQEAITSLANTNGVGSVPTIVQSAHGITGSGAKVVTATFTNKVTAGNSIVVVYGLGEVVDASTIILTITDSESNSYTSATTISQSTTLYAGISYVTNVAGDPVTASTVTLTLTGASSANEGLAVEIYELSGIIELTPAAVDQTGTGSGSSGTAVTTAAIVPIEPNEMAFMAVAAGNGVITAGSGWTLDSGSLAPVGGNLVKFGSQSRFISSLGSITPAATLGTSVAWAACCATFKPALQAVEGTLDIIDKATRLLGLVGRNTVAVYSLASTATTSSSNSGDLATGPYTEISIDITTTAQTGTSPTVQFFYKRKAADGVYYILWQSAVLTAAANTLSTSIGAGMAYNQSLGVTGQLTWTIGGSNTPGYTFSANIQGK